MAAGQQALNFSASPGTVVHLAGCPVWGGSDAIMLGEIEIAKRKGYTAIVLNDVGLAKAVTQHWRGK